MKRMLLALFAFSVLSNIQIEARYYGGGHGWGGRGYYGGRGWYGGRGGWYGNRGWYGPGYGYGTGVGLGFAIGSSSNNSSYAATGCERLESPRATYMRYFQNPIVDQGTYQRWLEDGCPIGRPKRKSNVSWGVSVGTAPYWGYWR